MPVPVRLTQLVKPTTTVFPITLLLLLIIVTPAFSDRVDFNPDLLCTYIANNTKIKDPRACNKYITCVDGKVITDICEGDLFYDHNAGNCVPPNTVKCYSSDPCAVMPNANGFVADPYACNGYYYCLNGRGSQGFCSSGMNFNPESNICIRNYPCDLKILPEDYCNIIPDGVFIKVPNSCSKYQVCWHGKLINGTCPRTFYFNALTGECDYATKSICVETATLTPILPDTAKCIQPNVFIPDGISCNGYYYCQGHEDGSMQLIHGVCPSLRFFDASNGGACVVRTNTTCTHNRCVTFGYHNIQLANINGDGCAGFQICQDGEIIGQSKCPRGKYFNELLQLCTTNTVTYSACVQTTTDLVGQDETSARML